MHCKIADFHRYFIDTDFNMQQSHGMLAIAQLLFRSEN